METTAIGYYVSQNCLVVPIQTELYDQTLGQLQLLILDRLTDATLLGVVVELSGVNIIDGYIWDQFMQLTKMTRCMGRQTVFTGFKPTVVSALMTLPIDFESLHCFGKLEQAIEYLHEDLLVNVKEEGDEEHMDEFAQYTEQDEGDGRAQTPHDMSD